MTAGGRGVAFVFPGQGSQRAGMLDAFGTDPAVSRLLDAAEALTGLELRRIASEGTAAELADTRAAQPLLYLSDVAWATSLLEAGVTPRAVAGHSLGELAALAIAGVFTPQAGLELVCRRAEAMARCAAETPGGMAAVLGMESASVDDVVAGIGGVWVANDNAPGQVVLSGTHAGIEGAIRALSEAGARKVVPLDVSGPFHSPLMEPAAEKFRLVLADADFRDADLPVIPNADPAPATDAETIRARLAAQITAPVRWTETMAALRRLDVQILVESGPGAVLTGLTRRIEGLDAVSCDANGLDTVLEVLS